MYQGVWPSWEGLAHVEDRGDAGVGQHRADLRLAAEQSQVTRLRNAGGRKDLHGDAPLEAQVPGFPYLAHAATPQRVQELVAPAQQQPGRDRSAVHALPPRSGPTVGVAVAA